MASEFPEIVEAIRARARGDRPLLVGIDGPGGAGKSTVAESVRSALEGAGLRVTVVPMDDFFLPGPSRPAGGPEQKSIGGDFDWQRLRDQVLVPVAHGNPARHQRYDWNRDELAEWQETPASGVIIVEGIYVTRDEIQSHYDLKVWIDAPRPVRLARGLERDGVGARSRWETDWMPSEDRYIAAHRPRERADLMVDGTRGVA